MLKEKNVGTIMSPSFPFVTPEASIDEVSALINKDQPAVLLRDLSGGVHILTKYDLIKAYTK
jgi:cystathionine beta-synthase